MAVQRRIQFNGIWFTEHNGYYRPNASYVRKGVESLHREIWKLRYGPVPKGHHIHHIDGNKHNNEIHNLECVSAIKHLSEHAKSSDWVKSGKAKEHLDSVRDKTVAWHRSHLGREWHREHAKRVAQVVYDPDKKIFAECCHCSRKFEVFWALRKQSYYCSNNCKAATRRKSKVDNESRNCKGCGSSFQANKYSRTASCSRKCSWKVRKGLQPQG
ncbi:MAG: HNH endonuclease [Patescibacteria group bacterium]|nr:HNH endonuclease [Patescibacteria group bacterium]